MKIILKILDSIQSFKRMRTVVPAKAGIQLCRSVDKPESTYLISILLAFFIANGEVIAENNAIRFVIMGNISGVLRECICPQGTSGGIARLTTAIEQIRKDSPNAIFLDGGRLTSRFNNDDEIRLLADLYYDLRMDVNNFYLEDYFLFHRAELALEQLFCGSQHKMYIPFKQLEAGKLERINQHIVIKKASVDVNITTVTANFDFTKSHKDLVKLWHYIEGYNVIDRSRDPEAIPQANEGLNVLMYNLVESQEDVDFGKNVPAEVESAKGYDVVIIGGGGFFEPELRECLSNKETGKTKLVVFPGVYGEHIIVLDIIVDGDGGIVSYEWELLFTGSVLPDETVLEKVLRVLGTF